jgi:hypothetical protein
MRYVHKQKHIFRDMAGGNTNGNRKDICGCSGKDPRDFLPFMRLMLVPFHKRRGIKATS